MPGRFAGKLTALRMLRGLSKSELARRLGLASHTYISHLEAERKPPSLELVVLLAAVLGTTTEYLLREQTPIQPPVLVVPLSRETVAPWGEAFANRVRKLRLEHDMTQAELASRLGLSANAHISFIEGGHKTPSIDLVVRLADLFAVTTDYLLHSEDSADLSA
ncbi:helix-turn-helix domain-containing protein [Oscillochloris sp. ZM17-4]|uniref:helix-turn-helix domain-containing protein n=1 Tax=Oscillochloris sp. ZM17-4 TaxID=2866714 RepID=UPI001C73C539|nr:helix-turn-helix transcriptional regulator [Oscillochloris sp. ZM17-4]MBX0326587.1 helix-turn-helix domain-containing protein [Oscillochloris sp. ZM17-4]